VLCPVVSPYRSAREAVRQRVGDRFVEVWVSAPVEVCADRDVKGLYARQRNGTMTGLTGVDDPYEEPLSPDVVVPTHEVGVDAAVELIVAALR
jgi:adenylylsulfate kinase